MKNEAQSKLIVSTAFERFRRFGLRRVTMSELATELRISKKTLYRHFPTKEALVTEVLETQVVGVILPRVAAAIGRDGPLAERVVGVWRAVSTLPQLVTPELMKDLRGEYPHLWEQIDARRRGVLQGLEGLLEEGRRSGEVRAEVNPAVAVRILLAVAEKLLVPDVLFSAPFSPAEAIDTLMTLLVRGAFVHPPDPQAETRE